MSPLWIRRLCIRAVDFLYGCLVLLPLGVILSKRALAGFGTGGWDESHIQNLDGKVAVVTGANAGIGYHTVRRLASKGAKVYLAARSESRAKAAIKRLLGDNPSIPPENLVWLRLDLSSQAQVVEAARELRAKEQRLDILVNNAGIDPYNYVRTSDGFEMAMAVNHIGHWTLTYCLLPLLKATAAQKGSDVRVVTVSSSGEARASPSNHFTCARDLDDACASPGWEDSCLGQARRYGTTKLANILFATELQRRMDVEPGNIISLSLNPGPVKTEGAAGAGARTTLFAAAADEVRENSERWKGRFLDGPGRVKSPSRRAQDVVAARNLWSITAAAVRATGALEKLEM
ncbi:short chain dehydrogenase domain-containing protein [Hirsutella rhossiliensis]|uniref:Short chain dehydrogenase domain-containing protein n=1 Tax=Hirsutella rhossiliensis TaxID=111463 RepID=A0A9P8N480_9HYPO|nr:short chain dehydrogenase domain-containing protein [Hirsutella rhossiliensis]KAH0966647.1 short chain dehydrogenase domain-containing protein [Hirsutella rhossiliensis]